MKRRDVQREIDKYKKYMENAPITPPWPSWHCGYLGNPDFKVTARGDSYHFEWRQSGQAMLSVETAVELARWILEQESEANE